MLLARKKTKDSKRCKKYCKTYRKEIPILWIFFSVHHYKKYLPHFKQFLKSKFQILENLSLLINTASDIAFTYFLHEKFSCDERKPKA
jgi:hypothetical protein